MVEAELMATSMHTRAKFDEGDNARFENLTIFHSTG